MSWVQKTMISLGAFWLSLWVLAPLIGWPLHKLTDQITYSDTIFNALALGIINSLDRTIAAIFAGVIIAIVISGRKSAFWSIIVAVLYLPYAPHLHWVIPATSWDKLWQTVALLFPTIACVAAAFTTARLHKNGENLDRVSQHGVAT